MQLAGFSIEEILYDGRRNIIYRALDKNNNKVILKVLKSEYPTENELIRFQKEYKILEKLKGVKGIADVIGFEKYKNSLFIIFKDSKGESLELIILKKIPLYTFYKIAKSVLIALKNIHEKKIIHTEIKPENILYDSLTGEVEIIDFSSSVEGESDLVDSDLIGSLDVSLAYISPEQTGRVNRLVDYRTDFYSLGATFYHLLTGKPPFTSSDPMDMIYSHIAKEPVSPSTLNKNIPKELSSIILKLLSKNPDDRYHTVYGILYDLELIHSENFQRDEFTLGSKDFSLEFRVSEKVYGRQKEIKEILESFNYMYKNGKPELTVITGQAGIGKSSLVKEISKLILSARIYFIFGEYEQYSKNLPFSGFIKAFTMLIRILLTEDSEDIENWKIRINAALGINAKIVTDVIPELELIIGSQPSVPYLEPNENSNRFYLIFQNFIRIFCNLNRPLVLFFDDFQWADSASLQMIKNLMSDSSLKYIFIILSFRTTEDTYNTPFSEMIDSIKKEKIYPKTIRLNPLKEEDITQILIDSFRSEYNSLIELSNLIFSKTSGNPFFISELLKKLANEKIIYLEQDTGTWKWDTQKIRNIELSSNIIDLLVDKIQALPEFLQEILCFSSCIGNRFDLWTISIMLKKTFSETIGLLENLIRQDFLQIPIGSMQKISQISKNNISAKEAKEIYFQFQHDRIQKAAYELIEINQRKILKFSIGKLLWKEKYSDEILFDIVNHLNYGFEDNVEYFERKELIILNLRASRKAKLSTAYESALEYLQYGLTLLKYFQNPWTDLPELTVQVYRELADLYFLNVKFDKLEECIAEMLLHTEDLHQITHCYKLLINYYTTISNYSNAMECGREGLEIFEIIFPRDNYELYISTELKEIKRNLKHRTVRSLLAARKLENEKQRLALELLSTLMPPAYLFNSQVWIILVLKSVNLMLINGISEQVYGFSCYGIILGSMFHDYKSGHEFGNLALDVAEMFQNKAEITKAANVMANFTLPFKEHLKNASEVNKRCLEAGRESGEFQHISYSLIFSALNSLYLGKNLSYILNEIIPQHILLCKQAKSSLGVDTISALRIVILSMTSGLDDKMELEVIRDYEEKFLLEWKKNNNYFTIFIYKVLKICNYYIQENYEKAFEQIQKAKAYLNYAVGLYANSEFIFYESLVLCALSVNVDKKTQDDYARQIQINQKQMKLWSHSCPENFQHKYLLVEAEIARINGRHWNASKLYDKAIEEANKNEFLQNEAIANEICARFYEGTGQSKIMRTYLVEAHYLYNRWGATYKIDLLERKYSDFFPKSNRKKIISDSADSSINLISDTSNHITNVVDLLDLNTLIKTSQTLAEEIVLDKLLKKIMRILFENAGAEKGLFIRKSKDDFFILASGNSNENEIKVFETESLTEKITPNSNFAPLALIHYVARVKKHIVIGDSTKAELFINDQYLRKYKPKSILCYPVLRQDNLIGIIYLENNLTIDAFTKQRLEVLNILSTQIAISFENSEFYANLEAKVDERTANLNQALQQVKLLKEKQDGDYFLTSLLIHPLGKNNIQNDLISIEFFIEQKKKFLFKNKEVEIGGDLCTADRIFLNNRSYVVVLNADAMGKSIQGAGGILVLGSVFKSILQRTHSGTLDNNIYPEKWIKNSFLEMQRIFESFDGYMLISLVLGLLDEENGILYFINVEHPKIILYRNNKASFVEKEERTFRKMGIQGIDTPVNISLFQMKPNDVIFLGSDGRDDIILGIDENGLEILNFEEELILESVEEGNGNLKNIYQSIISKGQLSDDLSMVRLGYRELEKKINSQMESEHKVLQNKIEELLNIINTQSEKKEYPILIKSYELLISLQPTENKYLLSLSYIYFKLKRYSKCIEYSELIKLRLPFNHQNMLRLIISHMRLKNYPRSNNLLIELLLFRPNSKKAKILELILSDYVIKSF